MFNKMSKHMRSLKIMQWNAGHLTSTKMKELTDLLIDSDIDICSVSEVWKQTHQLKEIPGYDHFYVEHNSVVMVATYIKKNLSVHHMAEHKVTSYECELDCFEAMINGKNTVFIFGYARDGSKPDGFAHVLEKIYCLGDNYEIFIAGDFNTKTPSLGEVNKIRLEAGKLLDQLIDSDDRFTILNDGSITRERVDHDPSAIDLTLVSNGLINLVQEWYVETKLSSDHLPIFTILGDRPNLNQLEWDRIPREKVDSSKEVRCE